MSVQTLPLVHGSVSCPGPYPVRFFLLRFVAFFALLALVNYVIVPGDTGWFGVNPTPFLLIPVFLGVRYGFSAGLSAGLLTVLLLVAGRYVTGQGISLTEHRYTLISFPLLGVLLGQVSEGLQRRGLQLEKESEELRRENHRVHGEHELLVLSRQDLQQRLEVLGAESDSLDEQLDEAVETCGDFVPSDLLAALARITHAGSAALYEVPPGARTAALVRVASLGDSAHFPECLRREDHQIVTEALARNCFLVQKTLLENPPSRRPGYLAAYPVINGPDRSTTHVLIVQDVPFHHIKPSAFEMMKSVCDQGSGSPARPRHDEVRHRSIDQFEFYAAMEAAVTTHTKYAVPSTLVRVPFDFDEGIDPAESFRDLLEVLPHRTLLSNSHEEGRRSVLFLLPANSDPVVRDALRDLFLDFVEELGLGREHVPHFVMTAPGESPQQLWGKLVAVGQDVSFR
ncbi:MAG: hypothetical protein QF405_04180 [Roseibacillus sp.]|jgi:hypothetical protein|nr:hypothetical protein [Roseibacillus sp.]